MEMKSAHIKQIVRKRAQRGSPRRVRAYSGVMSLLTRKWMLTTWIFIYFLCGPGLHPPISSKSPEDAAYRGL